MIVEFWKEKTYSLSRVRQASGKGIDCEHGLTISETLKALSSLGVTHYKVQFGIDAAFAIRKAVNGPVLVGVGYYAYPARRNGTCGQHNVAQLGGKYNCNFRDSHAVLVVGSTAVTNSSGVVTRYDAFIRDPNHYEPNPPTYDRMTQTQLNSAMLGLTNTGWSNTFALFSDEKKTLPNVPPPSTKPEDVMYNVGPSSTYRDAVLKAGTVLYADSTLTERYSSVDEETSLGFHGSGDKFHVVINGGRTNYVRKEDVLTTSKPQTRNYT
jgi:hypothetical protein